MREPRRVPLELALRERELMSDIEKDITEYRVEALIQVDLTVSAESFKEAEQLVDTYLGPASDDNRVEVNNIDSIEVTDISSSNSYSHRSSCVLHRRARRGDRMS